MLQGRSSARNTLTTEHHIHALFEGVFVHEDVKVGYVSPHTNTNPKLLGDAFTDYVAYLRHSKTLVERTYQLEKAGAFMGAGTPEGKAFAVERFAAGVTELRDMKHTTWVRSADPVPNTHGLSADAAALSKNPTLR